MPPKASAKPSAKPAAKPAAPAKAAPAAPKTAGKAAPTKAVAAAPAPKKTAAPTPSAGAANGVYIRGLTNESVADVQKVFADCGKIAGTRLRRNKFAIVWFEAGSGATKAVQQFNGKAFNGNQLSVQAARAAPKKSASEGAVTVFVGPIFKQMTSRKQVRGLFASTGKITKLRMYRNNTAFVRFDSAASANAAVKSVNGKQFQNKTLAVKLSVRK